MLNVPKSYLVTMILRSENSIQISSYFHIKDGSDIEKRLLTFTKPKLIEYIRFVGGELQHSVEECSQLFPIKSAPTLYVINILNDYEYSIFQSISNTLSNASRSNALVFGDNSSIRSVYTKGPCQIIRYDPVVYELSLCYEKCIEITECDPELDDYGETKRVYSLENALIWLPNTNHKFGIIACGDFAAVKPIMRYLHAYYNINTILPDLTPDMLVSISSGGQIQNATFNNPNNYISAELDIRTVTIYDENLANSRVFSEISSHNGSEQRSGFYTNHPALLRAGLGIARRYGRIWTPARLNSNELVHAALTVIHQLDDQLTIVANENLSMFLDYYSNADVTIGGKKITGEARHLFDQLIYYIITAYKNANKRTQVNREFLLNIIKHKTSLKMDNILTYECNSCGTIKPKCPNCGSHIQLKYENGSIVMTCANVICNAIIDHNALLCNCGDVTSIIDPLSHSLYYPSDELLLAVELYAKQLHPSIDAPNIFTIYSDTLYTFSCLQSNNGQQIMLSDLDLWRIRAHYHMISEKVDISLNDIKMKEKCKVNNGHPLQTDCISCLQRIPSIEKYETDNICLLRLFGIPIHIDFDGIHHGYEIADIYYADSINGTPLKIGIHVKSKTQDSYTNGLGRSCRKIKELYAQVFYSVFQHIIGQHHFDVIGIAIPNNISNDVICSMRDLLKRIGISFIVIDKTEWLKISDLARNAILFESETVENQS